jgi:hypothetical protein
MLLSVEIALRIIGYQPGKISYSQWFKEVEELSELSGFITDTNGIFKVGTQYLKLFKLQKPYTPEYTDSLFKSNYVAEIFYLIDDYHRTDLNNEFSKKLAHLKQTALTNIDTSIIHYSKNSINKEGFHSLEFIQYKSSKKKVLLLGDSFTWGHSTSNKTNSFANELLAKGYIVYNTGISGADVT